MGLNRDKFRNIVGGITTPEPAPLEAQPVDSVPTTDEVAAEPQTITASTAAGEGRGKSKPADSEDRAPISETQRFAKRGRPKGSKAPAQSGTAKKIKVSLWLSENIVNDLYEWAYQDRKQPGDYFDAALKPFHERESKRRKEGKG